MKYSYALTGAGIPVIREFETDKTAEIYEGRAVGLENGKVTVNTENGVLGVCAENHSGNKDILNARADGDRIRVDITSLGVYEVNMPEIIVNNGGAGIISCIKEGVGENMAGCEIIAVKKNDGTFISYKNGIEIKSVSVSGEYADISVSGTTDLFLGDILVIKPFAGMTVKLSADGRGIAFDGNGAEMLVTGTNEGNFTAEAVFKNKIFG